MSVRRNAAQQATEWAEKKKQQMERAKQLKEERKHSMMRVAENQIVGSNNSNGFGSGYNGNGYGTNGGYNQEFGQQANNSKYGQGKGFGYNDAFSQQQYGPPQMQVQGYGHEQMFNYNQEAVNASKGFGQGYGMPPKSNGPIKAMRDMGYENGMNQRNTGYNKQSYDQPQYNENISTKSSINTNYRKAFNPNTQNIQANQSNGFKGNSTTSSIQHQSTTQQKRTIQPSDSRRTIQSREKQTRYEPTQKIQQNPSSNNLRSKQPQDQYARMGGQEEQKYQYQPQKREAPARKMPVGKSQGGMQKMTGGYQYTNYDDEVSQQVIPAVNNKSKGGFGQNLGQEAFQRVDSSNLQECHSCGRSFNPEAYAKHSKICKKVFQQKRKQFNSQAHRIVSNEQKQLLTQAKRYEQVAPQKQQSKQNQPVRGMKGPQGGANKWKMQSEQFRAAMRAARGGGGGGSSSYGGAGGYDNSAQYDDRTPCPYCGRKFNDVAAQRHIPHCQTKAKNSAMRVGPARGGRGIRR